MKIGVLGIAGLLVGLALLVVGYSSVFTVSQTDQVLLVRLGEPVRVVTEPGLHFKAPFVDSVIQIDKRILDLEQASQEVIASDQKRLVVDAFARYRIKDALQFYQSVGSVQAANIQLTTLLNASLRRVLGEVTFIQVVRDEREHLMGRIRDQLDKEASGYGISVVDVRIRRADLPDQNSQAVYQRMQTERQREAAEFRAQGGQKAQEIRAKADREATVIMAEANSAAEQIRGQGDGERNRLFAEAYNKAPDFFAFYRSMTAYQNGLKGSDYPLPAEARFRLLPFLRASWRQAFGIGVEAVNPKDRDAGETPPMGSIAFADFLIGLGILFMLEGILFAAAPEWMRRAMKSALATPDTRFADGRHRVGNRRADPDLAGQALSGAGFDTSTMFAERNANVNGAIRSGIGPK